MGNVERQRLVIPHVSALLLVALLATQSSEAQTVGNARAIQPSGPPEFAALLEQAGSDVLPQSELDIP